ncbi:MAG TPA: hypothetical protein G4O14_15190 [Anaerolineae bacterium]|nr:hypothetical protein [Anaerolineae bacterium]
MGNGDVVEFYLCPGCLTPGDSPGSCPECGTERLYCCPGKPDNPCRRPLIDSGMVRTRAPLWWLQHSVTQITKLIEQD